MKARYDYKTTLENSEKVNWRVEDIIGGDKRLDFDRPFLPDSLARVSTMEFLSTREKLILNQIRGFGYLCTFGLVEEFILPFVLDHARPHLHGDSYRTRALLRFAGEEAKHIQLFKKFADEFKNGFGTACAVIGPAPEIARAVLSHHPLGVALVILHIEWMTQRHYIESIRDNQQLDPQFKSLLRHHWMEEAQHAKLDTLMVEALVEACSPAEIDNGIAEYADIGGLLDGGLRQQVELDMLSFERATGRALSSAEQQQLRSVQTQAIRWTYLGSGMTHPNFVETVGDISQSAVHRISQMAPAFC